MNGYLGIDIGSISTKGVILDENNEILASEYLWTEGDPVNAVKKLIKILKGKIDPSVQIKGIGTTGSARNLIGLMVGANKVKNEITAHAVGTLCYYPDVQTILEIGGQDSKIILLRDGIVTDYAMNTLCAAGCGAFLSSQAKRLDMKVEDFGEIALKSTNPVKIASRCTVFAESDLIHKAQMGYAKEDIIAGLCKSIVNNYLNNVGKGKKIKGPIVFQGGVSKNKGVVKYFEEALNEKVIVDPNSHLMGAIGIAILSKNNEDKVYSLEIEDMSFTTKGVECQGCANHCEVIHIFKEEKHIDTFGNKCPRGEKIASSE